MLMLAESNLLTGGLVRVIFKCFKVQEPKMRILLSTWLCNLPVQSAASWLLPAGKGAE